MCTFENERAVVVCDVAIRRVREVVNAVFGDVVQFTPITGQGTRVEVPPSVDEEVFQGVAREAIAAAQEKPGTPPEQMREEVETSIQESQSTALAKNK
jgi:hypothetical protein